MGIQYTFDYNVKITRELILNSSTYLTENRSDIYNVFNVPKINQKFNDLYFKKTLEFINMMFNNWNNTKIIGDKSTLYRNIFKSYILENKNFE